MNRFLNVVSEEKENRRSSKDCTESALKRAVETKPAN